MGDRSDFKHAVFGVSPRKVSAYLRQLKHLQAQRLTELQEQVHEQRAEQVRLKKELDELTARHRANQDILQHKELLINRTQHAIQAMQAGTQQEVADLQRQIEQKQLEHRQKIAWIEQETESYNQSLQSLLQEFGAKMQKFNATSLDLLEAYEQAQIEQAQAQAAQAAQDQLAEMQAEQGQAEQGQAEQGQVATEQTPGGQASVQEARQATPQQGTASEQEVASEKVVQLPVKPQSDTVTALRNATNSRSGMENMPGRVEMASASTGSYMPPVAPTIKPQVMHEANSAFWGNIGQYVSTGAGAMEDVYVASPQASYEAAYEPESTPAEAKRAVQQPYETAAANSSANAWQGESYEAVEYGEPGESKESEAVSTEILSIRNRYIVGKLAGVDLFDHTGARIVATGETITAEIVEIAERSGKLPDLIVNMKIPGVSTDK